MSFFIGPSANLSIPISVANGGTGLSSPGASGNILQSTGTGYISAVQSLALVSTQIASGASSLAWTNLSGFDTYLLIFRNATLTITGGYISYQVGTGAGPTYVTSNYVGLAGYLQTSSAVSTAATSTTSPQLHYPNFSVADAVNGSTIFYNMTGTKYVNAVSQFGFVGQNFNAGGSVNSYQNASGGTSGPYTALKIVPQAGVFSGTFSLYGISQ